VESVVHPHR